MDAQVRHTVVGAVLFGAVLSQFAANIPDARSLLVAVSTCDTTVGKCQEPPVSTPEAAPGSAKDATPTPELYGNTELVNMNVKNGCQHTADGFKFVLSSFSPNAPVSAAAYPIPTIFEATCPPPNSAWDCNPFSPPKATPQYSANDITLGWQATQVMLGVGHLAHFGYTLASGSIQHSIKAELLSTANPSPPCVALNSSVNWSIQNLNVTITVRNQMPAPMYLQLSGIVRQDPVTLDELLPANKQLMASMGTPLVAGMVNPGEQLPITLPMTADAWGVVVLADWYSDDSQPRPLQAQVFHARQMGTPTPRFRVLLPWVGNNAPADPSSVPSPTG